MRAELEHGVAVRMLSDSCELAQVSCSRGSERLSGPGVAGNCFVALDAWEPLDAAQERILAAAPEDDPGEGVSVFDLGRDLVEAAHESLLSELAEDGPRSEQLEARLGSFRDRMFAALREECGVVARLRGSTDLVLQPPGRRSTAYNPAERVVMGLHIDNHEDLGLDQRDRARVLCSLNVGFGERYLNFVNLPVRRLVAKLVERGVSPPATANELKDAFLSTFPDYPVLRVTLAPGQGYLCRTQALIHDGATAEGDRPDVSLMTMSRFSIPAAVA